ncbi:hypothetical protein [Jidongwangia harbinensis]|uniref:hypothetical protein n=1 Tax=Jidongwangia harbinensis TaxID=2878561 RepID=UPI001CD9EACF|nr:hypothetical protein [Jidongwangia harbinensis]MCA2214231.1 hypothetical protein [Jidongwangia harbinensis]
MTESEKSPASRPDRIVINDAIWVVARQDYVDLEPAVKESLFDDPQRLERAWDLTLRSLKREADDPEVAVCPPVGPADEHFAEEPDEFVNRYTQLREEVSRKPETQTVKWVRFSAHVAHVMSWLTGRA